MTAKSPSHPLGATLKVRRSLSTHPSSDMSSFTALPATSPQGEIQFECDAPADFGFFRIQAM